MNKYYVTDWFEGNELAANVWMDKYALREKGVIVEQTPDDTIARLANEFHRIEKKYKNPLSYEEIYDLLRGFKKVIPAGSPLFGIGNNSALTSLSNCYVIESPVDSYGGILKTDEELVQLMKRRGGVGVDISTLRPTGSFVSNSAGSSTGSVSFMSRYSNSTREVAQEGRRGALILTMDITHPDIEKFITSKDDLTKITGANISVKITDAFMRAVESNEEFDLWWSGTGKVLDEISYGKVTDAIRVRLKARTIWNKLIHQAWKTAEPGVLFWDRVISESPADCYDGFKTISTNPCGELPLCAYDSCRLMHVNVFEFVKEPFTKKAYFDIDAYLNTIHKAQRLMDDMIDLEDEKLDAIINKIKNDPESITVKHRELQVWLNIKKKLTQGRRTGLNPLLGLADAFAALGHSYDSEEAIAIAEMMAANAAVETYKSSIKLAKERGMFPIWNGRLEMNNPFIERIVSMLDEKSFEDYMTYGRRNIACLTIPPAGSVAIIAGVSSGIEPVFNLQYNRKRKVNAENTNKSFQDKNGDWWEEYTVYHPKYKVWLDMGLGGNGSNNNKSPYDDSTTNRIDPIQKVRLQGAIQTWIDHSISITNNLPENITEQEVSDIYMAAWRVGCKGVTIYREGSRDGVLTNSSKSTFVQHDAPKRPKSLPHDVYSVMSKGHHWVVCVGMMNNKPYEVFVFNNVEPFAGKLTGEITKINKGRYDLRIPSVNKLYSNITGSTSDEENLLTRMISTSLRHGADIRFIVEQLNKSEGDITSFGKAIARILKKYTNLEEAKKKNCETCGEVLIYEGGCEICPSCGNSKCS